MRRFRLYRSVDVTGVSGVGTIAEGVEFNDGWVALRWCSQTPSMILYVDVADMLRVHGHGGTTTICWIDAEPQLKKVGVKTV
jgi:hypothetical protein